MALTDSPLFQQGSNLLPMLLRMKMMQGSQGATDSTPTGLPQHTDFPMLMEQIRQGNQVSLSPDVLSRLGLMGG